MSSQFLDNLLCAMKKEKKSEQNTCCAETKNVNKPNKLEKEEIVEKKVFYKNRKNIFNPIDKNDIDANFVNIKPSNIRISTMTVIGALNSNFKDISLLKPYVCVCRTLCCNRKNCKPPTKKYKEFHNQKTVLIDIGTKQEPKLKNVKLFINGKISMPGLKLHVEIKQVTDKLIKILKKLHIKIKNNDSKLLLDENDIPTMKFTDSQSVLINSDYATGFKLSREVIFETLRNEYKFAADYDPDNYPGVNAKFHWNSMNKNEDTFGLCPCTKECFGNGDGHGNGNCRIVTIFIFASGKIGISGNCEQKMSDAYQYINSFLDINFEKVRKHIIETNHKKPIFTKTILKTNIINFAIYDQLCAV